MPGGDKFIFSLEGEWFGIDTEAIKGIVDVNTFFPLPTAPPIIKGVINIKGDMVAAVELAVLFGRQIRNELPFRVIIISSGNIVLGLSMPARDKYFLFKEKIEKGDARISDIKDSGYFNAAIDAADRKIKLLDPKAIIAGIEGIIKKHNNIFQVSTH